MVTFDVDQYLLYRVTDRSKNVQQNVHRIPPFRENDILSLEDFAIPGGLCTDVDGRVSALRPTICDACADRREVTPYRSPPAMS
jgi:hypothetical protein